MVHAHNRVGMWQRLGASIDWTLHSWSTRVAHKIKPPKVSQLSAPAPTNPAPKMLSSSYSISQKDGPSRPSESESFQTRGSQPSSHSTCCNANSIRAWKAELFMVGYDRSVGPSSCWNLAQTAFRVLVTSGPCQLCPVSPSIHSVCLGFNNFCTSVSIVLQILCSNEILPSPCLNSYPFRLPLNRLNANRVARPDSNIEHCA